MSVTPTGICNMALSKMGEKRIDVLTGDSQEAIWCNIFYEHTRNEILEEFEWSCAIKRARLAQLEETPITEDYEYYYQLPVNPKCLKVLNTPDNPTMKYKVEEDKLLTNEDEVIIRYIQELKDTAKMTPLLIETIVLRLASKLAIPLTNNQKTSRELYIQSVHIANKAIGSDGRGSETPQAKNTDWVDAGRND